MNVDIIKSIIAENLNIDKTKIYNFNKKFKKIKDINEFKTINDISLQLSYLYVKEKLNNNNNSLVSEEKINRVNLVKDNVPNVDLSNYVFKKKYDKLFKEYKEYKEQNDGLMECYENKINEYKEEIINLKQKIKKLDKSSFDIMNEEELKEQNEELIEENQKYLDIIIKHNLSHLLN